MSTEQAPFADQIAVITGGGDGMGRSLAVTLASQGCHVSICDVSESGMAETLALCRDAAGPTVRLSSSLCDVSDEEQVLAFRDDVVAAHETDQVHLVFNNAGVGGGGSFINDERVSWERTFDICWGGVYLCSRAFLPLLVAGSGGHIVNTSSVNGFWASMGPSRPHTSYSAAKFAVRGFTEALMQELRLLAPHVQAHVVMPGHIGTGIAINSALVRGFDPATAPEVVEMATHFRNAAPTTSDDAAQVILDAMMAGQWRILIGDDAHTMDMMVREDPENAYELEFLHRMNENGALTGLTS